MASADHALPLERLREIGRTCTYFTVRKATRVLADAFDEALRPHELRGTQFSLLALIGAMEESTVGRLAGLMAADRTTLTRTLAPLEREGLVASEPGNDRRERVLRLTEAGRLRLAAAYPAWAATQADIVARLGNDAWVALMTGARAVHSLPTSGTHAES
jgi:DNA-binding MarR family transcriptional regulator